MLYMFILMFLQAVNLGLRLKRFHIVTLSLFPIRCNSLLICKMYLNCPKQEDTFKASFMIIVNLFNLLQPNLTNKLILLK